MMSTDHHPNGRKSNKRRISKVCSCADSTQNLTLKKMGTKHLRKNYWLHAKISGEFQLYKLNKRLEEYSKDRKHQLRKSSGWRILTNISFQSSAMGSHVATWTEGVSHFLNWKKLYPLRVWW